ncbi:leucine-rich repeat domain-containing protein [Wolbachia endosymbiont (group A) of Myopa testacea]|uniref:leucine-rich repeat domain-containing protein n=1 Tax=Wolbachia endosymbiont (group A) of Myopa testacea TaxID=3066148 RepID=UPI0033409EC1
MKALAEGNFTNLEWLSLSGNKIGDEGVKALANGKLTSLTSLNLSNNNIGDEGVKELSKVTKLTSFNLSYSNVSNECANKLANLIRCGIDFKRHPNLQIKSKNNNKYYVCGGIAIGLFLGLSIAYLAGAATLTPVGACCGVSCSCSNWCISRLWCWKVLRES